MNILVLGSGGREHALIWKLSQNHDVIKIFCAPGNAGTALAAENIDLAINDANAVREFAVRNSIDLTVIGPEAPLVAGVADGLRATGIEVFGPSKLGAMLEGSKKFAKEIMNRYGVPTPKAQAFSKYDEALAYTLENDPPMVIKADGLAAGKGVIIAMDIETARNALTDCFVCKKFGSAGENVLIEEYLEGQEVSLLAFTDGKTIIPMVPAQDYKRVFDGDAGLNTGGMGSYSPVPIVDEAVYDNIVKSVLEPTVKGLQSEGIDYRGVLYAGVILTDSGPKVLEFNARFGDPETQAILPRMSSDLVEIMLRTSRCELSGTKISWLDAACVSVVLASGGYPEGYETGYPISGLDEAATVAGVNIFHAGTAIKEGRVVTAGGRVLNVSALGVTFSQARQRAYEAAEIITFEKMHYRRDIGERAAD